MARIEIEDWQITIAAESKFWSHGIDRQQVFAVLNHRWISMRNRAGRAAPFVLVGRDDQGGALHCNSHRADQSPGNLATDHGLVLQAERSREVAVRGDPHERTHPLRVHPGTPRRRRARVDEP